MLAEALSTLEKQSLILSPSEKGRMSFLNFLLFLYYKIDRDNKIF